jgi:hypothetical protein
MFGCVSRTTDTRFHGFTPFRCRPRFNSAKDGRHARRREDICVARGDPPNKTLAPRT